MWTIFMPEELTVTLSPRLNSAGDRIICTYEIIDKPLTEKIGRYILGMIGDLNKKNVRITPECIEISIPTINLPYRIKNLEMGNISITVKKK